MAYNTENLVKLKALQALAQKAEATYAKKTALTTLQTKVDALTATGGEPNVIESVKVNGTALTPSSKAVNITVASGSSNGTIAVNGTNVAVKGLGALAYRSTITESQLDSTLKSTIIGKAAQSDVTALQTAVNTLNGSATTAGSVAKQVADAVAGIVADAPEAYDTLVEISNWISSHSDSAASMNTQINTNKSGIATNKSSIDSLKTLVGTLPKGATSTTVVGYITEAINALNIGDYAKITEVATTVNEAIATCQTYTDGKLVDYVKKGSIATDAEVTEMLGEIYTA